MKRVASRSKRYLLTGGAGFIGSHLTEFLLKQGDEVCIIDNLSTGQLANISHLQSRSDFRFINDTVLNKDLMLELVKDSDVVVHLAAAVGVKYIIDNPLESLQTNVRGTEVVLEICSKLAKKIFVASTSEVYGKQSKSPLREEDDCVMGNTGVTRWSYACTKALDEFWALAYYRKEGLPVVIGRFFNTVGPRQRGHYGMVIPRFVEAALSGSPISVFGDGTQTRTFTSVHDVVRAVTMLLGSEAAIGQVVNIGGVGEITILELAKRIKEMTGSSSEIVMVPYKNAYSEGFEDMPRRVPDLTKLRDLTAYKPELTLDQILIEIIDSYDLAMRGIAEDKVVGI